MFKLFSLLFGFLRFQKKDFGPTTTDDQFWEHLDGAEFSVVVDRDAQTTD